MGATLATLFLGMALWQRFPAIDSTWRRGAPGIGLWIESERAAVVEARVAGGKLMFDGKDENFGFIFDGAPPSGIAVRILVENGDDSLTVRMGDRGRDPSIGAAFAPPSEHMFVRPAVAVTATRSM